MGSECLNCTSHSKDDQWVSGWWVKQINMYLGVDWCKLCALNTDANSVLK